ncbi:deaminase domain-containing protein [Paenibacillus durus]|uniref:deaminase domain-containing protein n=1 Tax=Paenibacillus durus TaxID=44251 RepID=UPI0038B2E240
MAQQAKPEAEAPKSWWERYLQETGRSAIINGQVAIEQADILRDMFKESGDSLIQLGKGVYYAAAERNQKKFDSVDAFLDYLSLGIPKGMYLSYVERANKAFDSPNDTANWLTLGFHGTIREAMFPEDAWSPEHWSNIINTLGIIEGGSLFFNPKSLWKDTVPEIQTAESSQALNSKPVKEAEGTGENRLPNRTIDSLYEKTQNVRGDINREIEKIRNSDEYKNLSKTQRDKLDRKLRKLSSGNVAVADVSIPGINKEFQAHSQIHSSDSVGSNVGDFSYSKVDKSLETYVDDEFPRFNDTEAKILEDIASQIKDPNVKGRIDLFTELDACQSCSNLIMEFRRKFPNIQLNVYSKNMR